MCFVGNIVLLIRTLRSLEGNAFQDLDQPLPTSVVFPLQVGNGTVPVARSAPSRGSTQTL